MKDDITLGYERESGETKQQAAVRNISPLIEGYITAAGDTGDQETNLADMLTDLHHWAEANDVNFDAALDLAEENHRAETD